MSYSLKNLAVDIKRILKKDGIEKGCDQVCIFVQKALMNQDFVIKNLGDRKNGEPEREILYEDEELGFCICGHVYDKEANGNPHDHGSSWAVYGQATGETEMTDWKIAKKESETIFVQPDKTYIMKPGNVHFYATGKVHSPKRKDPVRLLRIEGKNLDNIERSRIKVL